MKAEERESTFRLIYKTALIVEHLEDFRATERCSYGSEGTNLLDSTDSSKDILTLLHNTFIPFSSSNSVSYSLYICYIV